MREYVSKALDMYYGNITRNSLAKKRLDHGKDIMEIDECLELLMEKMELLGNALESFNNLRSSFFQIALGLILGIVPLFYIFSPFGNELFDAVFAIVITIGILSMFLFGSRLYWKRLKRKEIK